VVEIIPPSVNSGVPGTQTGVDLDVFADSIFERLEKRENEIRIWPRLCAPRLNEATPQTDEMYRSPGHGSTKDRVAPVEQLTNARQ
jgi:hypothetical protein